MPDLFSMRFVIPLLVSWILYVHEGTGFWMCNKCFDPFIGEELLQTVQELLSSGFFGGVLVDSAELWIGA